MLRYGLAGAIQMPSYAASRSSQSPAASVGTHSKRSPTCSSASLVNWWVRFAGSKSPTTPIMGAALVIVPAKILSRPVRREERTRRVAGGHASHANSLADHRAETFHPLQTLGETLAAKIEDELAHTEPSVGRDVVRDLRGAPRERSTLPARPALLLAHVVTRRLVGDGERLWIAPFSLDEAIQLVKERAQLGRREGDGRVGAHRVPAVAEARRPAQRRLAVSPHPDGRMRLLDGMRRTRQGTEAVEPARE